MMTAARLPARSDPAKSQLPPERHRADVVLQSVDVYGQVSVVDPAHQRCPALTRFAEVGYLDTSNNYAERCMTAVAVGRKAFFFVGSERAGHAAAIYYSLVESCKANAVNPLTYLAYIVSNARNKAVQSPTPTELSELSAARPGPCPL